MAIDALNELPESTALPAPAMLKANAEEWGRAATARLGEDYAKIVRALQAFDTATIGVLNAPAGTRLVFDQGAAPTGWTRDTAINDRVVRIVSGTRADGGTWTISGLQVQGHILSVAEMPQHSHGVTDPAHAHNSAAGTGVGAGDALVHGVETITGVFTSQTNTTGIATTTTGASNSHDHGITSAGTWRPLHRDMIVASKD